MLPCTPPCRSYPRALISDLRPPHSTLDIRRPPRRSRSGAEAGSAFASAPPPSETPALVPKRNLGAGAVPAPNSYPGSAPVAIVNPDAMIAVVRPGVRAIVPTPAGIMARDPAAPATAVMPRHPHPVIPLVPVATAMIIRPVTNGYGETERLRLRHQRCGQRHDRCQQNQKFSFHIVFDHLAGSLFGQQQNFVRAHPGRPHRRLSPSPYFFTSLSLARRLDRQHAVGRLAFTIH